MERAVSAKQNVKKRHADAAGGGILQKRKTEAIADLQKDDLQDFQQPGEALKILEKKAKPPPAAADSPDALAEAMEEWASVAELGEDIQKGSGVKVGAKPKGRGKKKEEVVEEASKAESMAVEEPEEEKMELDEEDGVQESQEEEEQDDDQVVEVMDDGHDNDQGWQKHDDTAPWRQEGKGQRHHDHGGWHHHDGWGWKRRKPHWAQHGWRHSKGRGKGRRDEWGGEYVPGGYRDVAGNFFPYPGMFSEPFNCLTVCHIVQQPRNFNEP